MKKIITAILLVVIIQGIGQTQDINGEANWRDQILRGLDTARQDTSRVLLIAELANYYKSDLPDSALFYGYKALALARQIKFPKGEVRALGYMIIALNTLGNDSKALQMDLQGLKIAEKNNLILEKAELLAMLGGIYNKAKNHTKALDLYRESKVLLDSLRDFVNSAFRQLAIGETYLMLNQLDSALYYCQSAYANAVQLKVDWPISYILLNLGKIEGKKGNMDLALAYFRQSLSFGWNADVISNCYFSMAQLYQQINKPDSCIYYANKSLEELNGRHLYSNIIEAHVLLSDIYEKRDPQKALQHSKMAIAYKDSLDNLGKTTSLESLIAYDEQERQSEIDAARTAYRNQIKQYALIAGLLVFLLIAYILYRNNQHKQKAYALLQQQKQETDVQKAKAEVALQELKSTQAQLIQSEKMASLGELTAGIAHEIQNPLNFVNNFSEVNKELLIDVKDEMQKGNYNEAKEIIDDVIGNEEKINLHGKRADAIVKGMLQHSKASTGKKELTDINKLADEYLRLAYHGMRAKDKNFNAVLMEMGITTDFDERLSADEAGIGKINIVPQDIGRVLLNLINNAFYAVNEKSKNLPAFVPIVIVVTKKLTDKVNIIVTDNGYGIPQNIIDKIFQPFFTTKPTGQGTGLGLSLSYDIIKAHGGEMKVETKDGEGSEFIITLPQ